MKPCQHIIKKLLEFERSYDKCGFYRELPKMAKIDREEKCGLKLEAFYEDYVDIVGQETAQRVENFDENSKDWKKIQQVHMEIGYELKNTLINARSWRNWFLSTW